MSSKCAKCKLADPASSGTWCLGCSAWEAIERELTGKWSGPAGLRTIAENLVVSAAREIRALRALSAGLGRAQGELRAGAPDSATAGDSGAGSHRAPQGLAAKSAPKPPVAGRADREEASGEYSYTYETDVEDEEEIAEDKRKPFREDPHRGSWEEPAGSGQATTPEEDKRRAEE